METLNSTITAFSFCAKGLCEYCIFHKEKELCEDAKNAAGLYYLKEYKELLNSIYSFLATKNYQKDISFLKNEEEENLPLTLEELSSFKNLPVWVEEKEKNKIEDNYWAIFKGIDKYNYAIFNNICLPIEYFGTDWIVYKKEHYE